MTHGTQTSSTGDWLVSAAKSNPEGLLLLAAGCALLLRSGSSFRRGVAHSGHHEQAGQSAEAKSRKDRSELKETVAGTVNSAREYAADVGKSVGDKASGYASAVSEYADETRRTIVDQSGRVAEQAQTAFQTAVSRILAEQPLAVAVAGLAAGAAVAAAFPVTDTERQTLGPAGERLAEAAASAGEHLSEAASKAGGRLMDVAEEKGLNVGGLKEVASDVAGVFENSLRGGAIGSEGRSRDDGKQLASETDSQQVGLHAHQSDTESRHGSSSIPKAGSSHSNDRRHDEGKH